MSGDTLRACVFAMCLILFVYAMISMAQCNENTRDVGGMEGEAVLRGHAEWVSDENGRPAFQWKE